MNETETSVKEPVLLRREKDGIYLYEQKVDIAGLIRTGAWSHLGSEPVMDISSIVAVTPDVETKRKAVSLGKSWDADYVLLSRNSVNLREHSSSDVHLYMANFYVDMNN